MLFKNDKAISPVVATLVLIVVAIIGAAAVGVILGAFSSDVSNQASADNSKTAASSEITVGGSTTVQPVSDLLAKAYMDANSGVKITVSGGGSGAGIAGIGLGSLDIGASSAAMSDAQKTQFPNVVEHVIGGSAVVVITNKALPGITAAALTAGTTSTDMGILYSSDPLAVGTTYVANAIAVHRAEASGTEETFARFATGNPKASDVDSVVAKTAAPATGTPKTAIGNQGVYDTVATTDYAIGFVDYGIAKDNIAKEGTSAKVRIVPIDKATYTTEDFTDAAKTDATIKSAVKEFIAKATTSKNYPVGSTGLCRPLEYITAKNPSAVVNNFVNFASGPGALSYFHTAGYWGVTELQSS